MIVEQVNQYLDGILICFSSCMFSYHPLHRRTGELLTLDISRASTRQTSDNFGLTRTIHSAGRLVHGQCFVIRNRTDREKKNVKRKLPFLVLHHKMSVRI